MGAAILCSLPFALPARAAQGNGSDPRAVQLVQRAVDGEIALDANDHAHWMYKVHTKQPGKDSILVVIDVPGDSVHRCIWFNGKPVDPEGVDRETRRIEAYIHDPSAQARRKKNEAHDDEQAAEVLRQMPRAFIWSIRSETPEYITLAYHPDPNFSASSMELKVMSKMTGEMVLTKKDEHIYSLRGRLTEDVFLGFGLVRLKSGGSFDFERRDVGGAHWQVVESHVHIDGHALLLKTISQQEDEWKSEFKPSPANNLTEAARILQTER